MKMMNIPYNNYKTVRCKYFELEGVCKFGKNCTFAHGMDELRAPYDPLPNGADGQSPFVPEHLQNPAPQGSNFNGPAMPP